MASGNPTQSINPFENFSPTPAVGGAAPAAPASAGWGAAIGGGAWAPAPAAPPAAHETEISPRPTYTLEHNEPQPTWSQAQGLPPAPQQHQGAWGTAPPDASAPSSTYLLPANAQTSTSAEAAAAAAGGSQTKPGWFKSFGSSAAALPPPGAQGGPPDAGDTRPLLVPDNPSAAAAPKPEQDASKYAFYNLRRYRPYFNVDTKEVLWRVLSSFIGVFKANFVEKTLEQPDLYGPFWVATTLIFVTAAAGNLASYIQFSTASPAPPPPANATKAPTANSSSDEQVVQQWYADPTKLGSSAGIFYGYVFILSILLWLWIKYMRGDIKLVNVFCMYGYSMTIFIPVAMLCVIPITVLQWVLIMVATALSGGFLVRNLRSATAEVALIKTMWLLGVVLALHVGLGLALKLYFFKY